MKPPEKDFGPEYTLAKVPPEFLYGVHRRLDAGQEDGAETLAEPTPEQKPDSENEPPGGGTGVASGGLPPGQE